MLKASDSENTDARKESCSQAGPVNTLSKPRQLRDKWQPTVENATGTGHVRLAVGLEFVARLL